MRTKNAEKIYATLFMAVMLVGFTCPYQPPAFLTTASPSVTTARAGSAHNTTARVDPVLNFTVMVPYTNLMRRQYGNMCVDGLDNLGINASIAIDKWQEIFDRALVPSLTVRGKTYAEGGFDIACIGWSNNPDPDPYLWLHSSQFVPYAQNYYLWNNTQNDYLCNRIRHEMNQTKLLQLIQQQQALVYEVAPSVALYYPDTIVTIAKNLSSTPFATNYSFGWPGVEYWNYTSSPLTSVTVAQSITNPWNYGLTPGIGSNYVMMSQALYGPIFGEGSGYGLLMRGAAGTLDVEPYMAYGNYTHSADYRNWNFTIRPGIEFQNGEELDARDLVYTLRYIMTQSWGSTNGFINCATLRNILGSNTSVYWAGEQGTPGETEPLNYYKVRFRLPDNYSYFLPEICTLSIVPSAVLVNSSSGIPSYHGWHPDLAKTENFRYTPFNLAVPSTYGYYCKNGTWAHGVSDGVHEDARTGPFGAGPYQFVYYDWISMTLHLTKYAGYFNKAALEARGVYKISDYYVTEIQSLKWAISALKTGTAQVLDSGYNFQGNVTMLGELDPSFCSVLVLDGLMAQEVGFNMQHPIFGTGLGTPVGMADSSKAAEAAKHMRRGIEYLFLKDTILKNMTHGYATYGITTAVTPGMFGFNHNIALRNDTTLTQRLLAIKEFEAAGYHFYVDLTVQGVNATTPNWTFDQYGFNIQTKGAGDVSVKFYTVAPPGAAGAPGGAVPIVYLDLHGFQLSGSNEIILYVYYNRTRVAALGVNETDLALYIWNTTGSQSQWTWSALTSTHLALNSTTGVVFAVAPHLSYFAVFGISGGGGGGGGGGGIGPVTLAVMLGGAVIFGALIALVVLRKRGKPRA